EIHLTKSPKLFRQTEPPLSALGAAQAEPFTNVVAALKTIPESYLGGQPDLLFYSREIAEDLNLRVKPFSSVLGKLHRRNVIFNNKWPSPSKSYVNPANLYSEIDDLLRTRLVCRYLDGPRFVSEHLKQICDSLDVVNETRPLSTEAGYYAWHFYFQIPVELAINGQIDTHPMWCEIQITTQLAELIAALTHDLYEVRREGAKRDDLWKWMASSPEFRSSYIGHGLHLLEGVIQSFRDDVIEDRRTNNNGEGKQE
ncbi:hypothetical protein, partial [Agrobacterium pusense]|uniref:hypothetical protein n=1 Tax=Agrobacterium pusense TaxID=648995 RepID=UPI0032DA71FC